MTVYQRHSTLVSNEQLGSGIYRLTLQAPDIAAAARPGQFVMLRVAEGLDPLLRRPFSIHRTTAAGHIQLLFKVVGRGTSRLAVAAAGQQLDLLGPLGHGFTVAGDGDLCLVGGGMGIAPLLFLSERLLLQRFTGHITLLLGGRTGDELAPLVAPFEALGLKVLTATDDGSLGHHGLVTDLLTSLGPKTNRRVYACGPYPMMRTVAGQCAERGWDCQVSMETMMACGLAACLGCALPRAAGEGYLHACKQGPVFEAKELLWP